MGKICLEHKHHASIHDALHVSVLIMKGLIEPLRNAAVAPLPLDSCRNWRETSLGTKTAQVVSGTTKQMYPRQTLWLFAHTALRQHW